MNESQVNERTFTHLNLLPISALLSETAHNIVTNLALK